MSMDSHKRLLKYYDWIEKTMIESLEPFFIMSDQIFCPDETAWKLSDNGFTSKIFRGKKMGNWQGVYNEVGAALQFPGYFGENIAAFDECITDMSWMEPGRGYVYTISEAHKVFTDYSPNNQEENVKKLVRRFVRAAEFWRAPELSGELGETPSPALFRIILSTSSERIELVKRMWGYCGVKIGEFNNIN